MTLSDMTRLLQTAVRTVRRCLPTLQLADAIWQVIFEELAKYLQRQFFAQGTVQDLQRIFKGARAPARSAKKLWVPSFWLGILGTSPGSGGGTNPLEARHASWEAELKSRTKAGLLTALRGMQHLYSKWVTVFELGQAYANVRFLC